MYGKWIICTNRASKYDTWFQMACAIKNTFGEDGYDVFTRFSKLCKKYDDKYDEYEFKNKEIWDNLKYDGELTMGSIKYWAKVENENIYNQINMKLEKTLFDASGSLNMLLDIVNQSTDDETISTISNQSCKKPEDMSLDELMAKKKQEEKQRKREEKKAENYEN